MVTMMQLCIYVADSSLGASLNVSGQDWQDKQVTKLHFDNAGSDWLLCDWLQFCVKWTASKYHQRTLAEFGLEFISQR